MKEYKGYIHNGYLIFYTHGERAPETDVKVPLDPQDYWIKECDGVDCRFMLRNGRAVIVMDFLRIR